MGYCSYSAASRLLFPRPSMETTYYKGKYPMPYKNKVQLLTALATKMTPLGFNKHTWGSNEYRGRLDLFANGTAPWPFVGNRPKPNQGGGWFLDCYNVSPDQESFYTEKI